MINDIRFAYICGYLSGAITFAVIASVAVLLSRKGKRSFYRNHVDEYDDGHWICPRCGAGVGWCDMEDKYCSDCGQKIDWRKTK